MFTGLVESLGQIVRTQPLGAAASGLKLTVSVPPAFLADVQAGDSIAINGACMTVTRCDPGGTFDVDVSAASLACTAGLDGPGTVNLEKAMRADARLGGHLVSGHVDGIGRVVSLAPVGESWRFVVRAPRELARFLACKGSVAVNGVSLTVNEVADAADGCTFTINLIPHTMAHTTLGTLQAGSAVNLEIDLVARYVERMLGNAAG